MAAWLDRQVPKAVCIGSNLETEQTTFVSSIETKLLAIDQRLSDIVVSVKLLSDSVADLKANPVHSQSTNSNMNQGRQRNALDHSAEENILGTQMDTGGDNDSTSESSVKSMTGRPPSFGYNGTQRKQTNAAATKPRDVMFPCADAAAPGVSAFAMQHENRPSVPTNRW